MSARSVIKRKTITDIKKMKGNEPVVCLTAYTAPVARIADECAELILVGDSLGMVLYGMESTVPVSIEMMVHHGRAVVRSSQKALVVIDMPFGSYQESRAAAFKNAARLMKDTGASAVKLEGGAEMAETVAYLTARGIPVMGHIGLQPQSVHAEGGYRVMGKSDKDYQRLVSDALALEKAGAFALVLECVIPELAADITGKLSIPTIGIGAGNACDGQILVFEDMTGMTGQTPAKFVKQYARLFDPMAMAAREYASEVKKRTFPGL